MKVVINNCYGGFSLSREAYGELGIEWDGHGYGFGDNHKNRANHKLVAAVEKLGSKANGEFAELKIVEVPDNVEWTIKEYDGIEWVAEVHRTWG